MSRSGTSGLTGLMKGRLIHFDILVSILDYFTSLFEERLEYSKIIRVHRSAISAYHEKVDYLPVGQHPLVTSLMP